MEAIAHPLLATEPSTAAQRPARWPLRWIQAWNGSLRLRLLVAGLLPLLLAFPFVIGVLAWVGGDRASHLLDSNLRGQLSGAANVLNQQRGDAAIRVAQLAKSSRIAQLVDQRASPAELSRALALVVDGSGFDVLVVVGAEGQVLASSSGVAPGIKVADSWVLRQARVGVTTAAFERFDADELATLSPQLPGQAKVIQPGARGASVESRGLMLTAAAHFPLSVSTPEAVLVGGILCNGNSALVEHVRELIYPSGSLPGEAQGMAALLLGPTSVAASRQHLQGEFVPGRLAAPEVEATVLGRAELWLGIQNFHPTRYRTAYAPIADGDGRPIGMVMVGFPSRPYELAAWLVLGLIAGLLALTMLGISVVFIRVGRELTQQLDRIGQTMSRVRSGDRRARIGTPLRDDDLGRLARHFDTLLDTIDAQDGAQRAAQRAVADEAMRRRSLFEHERDGVVILHADGRVFEANPRCAAMLGHEPDQLQHLRISDWDGGEGPLRLRQIAGRADHDGVLFETVHRRRDGSTYEAEVSMSRAEWAGRTFVIALHRDITHRKAMAEELATYQCELELLVEQRTKQLNDRSEQLDAIFALSPDGFVSFDGNRRVVFASPSFLSTLGRQECELIGLDEAGFSALMRTHSHDQAPFPGVAELREAYQAVDGGDAFGSMLHQQFQLTRPAPCVLEVGIRLSGSAQVSQVLYFRDVTYESEVDRMKTDFLTTAAHELRTPMTSIYGFVNLLRTRDPDPARRADILATIAQQSELMMSIINQLLDLARIEARRGEDFSIERLSLDDVLQQTVAAYRPPAGREPPTLPAPPALADVVGDRQKLHQALLNVISNAYKYSPQGGPVHLLWLHEDTPDMRRVGIGVRDHGIGMTAEQLDHVCERFYRADASGNIPGTGLGMSIVKEIVELHGGMLQIDSTPGEGTTVTLWFPLAS